MVPGGAGERGWEGGKGLGTMGGWSLGQPLAPMDINEDTDISIRYDLSFILTSVIRLNFYNFSFSPII